MATPSKKAPTIDQVLKDLTGKDRNKTIVSNTCMLCEDPDMNFTDELSRKEYVISGLCQTCQNNTYG